MVAEPVIRVADLSKTYQEGLLSPKDIQALRGVSFDVFPGEVFGLLGPNGAGKTTFIKALLGIIRPSGGSATLLGYDAGDPRGRQKVGYLPERLVVPRHHTAYTALEYYGQLSGMTVPEVRARQGEVLELVGLADRASDLVRKYSKGMQQRIGLGQALMHNPDILILDEPTDGLDPVGRAQVRSILDRLRDEGKTIFLNSHLLQEVELICDRVAILDRGLLKRVGPVHDMTASDMQGDGTAASRPEKPRSAPTLQVEMELLGAEDAVRAAMGEHILKHWRVVSAGRIRLSALLPDQPAIDTCVDALRRGNVSIVSLAPHRASLEDVFLAAVNDEEATADQAGDQPQSDKTSKKSGKKK